MWKGLVLECLEHLAEKHGGSTFVAMENVEKFFLPWTVTRSVCLHPLRPDVSGIAVDTLLFHEAGLVHRYQIYRDPFPQPALRDGVVSRLLSCVGRAMAIAKFTHLRILILSSGAPPGQVPVECFPGGAPHVRPPSRRNVSFTDEVTLLGDAETQVCSPEADLPPLILPVVVTDISVAPETVSLPLILPVVVEESSIAPVAGLIELVPSARSFSLPPSPGFSPFAFPLNDGGLDADELCARLGMNCSSSLSPIGRVCSDIPELVVSPGVGVLVSLIVDGSSDVAPAVGYTGSSLLSVDSTCGQTMLWAPAAPQDMMQNVDREIPVPRWRLAQEGSFLAERSPESIRSLGAGCTFRQTTYYASDYASPVGDYGLPLHHPRFIEWIGVPQSAGLMEITGAQWVDKLSRDQAVVAAVHSQRDVGLMQTNVDVLDQYALSLQKTASRMIELCLGCHGFPVEDVAAGALGSAAPQYTWKQWGCGVHP